MIEINKIQKNKEWFLDKIKKAPGKVKEISKVPDADETRISREFFYEVFLQILIDTRLHRKGSRNNKAHIRGKVPAF